MLADHLAVDPDAGGEDPLDDCTHGARMPPCLTPADALLITVAPTGAETAKADCPQLPTTPEEIARTAAECEAAGAAMIHLHVRDGEHAPTLDQSLLREWVAAVRSSSSLVVQLSTGGSVHDPLDERLKVLDAEPDSLQPHHGHHQLRRRRLPQPVALREGPLPARPRARRRARSSSSSTSARCTRWAG